MRGTVRAALLVSRVLIPRRLSKDPLHRFRSYLRGADLRDEERQHLQHYPSVVRQVALRRRRTELGKAVIDRAQVSAAALKFVHAAQTIQNNLVDFCETFFQSILLIVGLIAQS